ncbi:MAG: MBL fold metallo-hydrolase [Lachnospiraceae bacterium]|nr:MBL fold metallo-hydrolase [Lachnospiraceae bacterium]
MRFCPLASGSSGNCIYVGSETTHLLIDDGISGKRTEAALSDLDLSGREIKGILITHEHSDHVKGLGVFSRKWGVPIYGTERTLEAISRDTSLGKVDPGLFRVIRPDLAFNIGDFKIKAMHISHDAADPVAYRIYYGKQRVAVCTDLGCYNDYTVECLKEMDGLLIEANHDVRMLQTGSYPYYLKQRILGDRGHLSNENSGKLLSRILADRTKFIFLGHLSHENNLPELAYEAVRAEITMGDNPYRAEDFRIMIAKRDEPSPIVTL